MCVCDSVTNTDIGLLNFRIVFPPRLFLNRSIFDDKDESKVNLYNKRNITCMSYIIARFDLLMMLMRLCIKVYTYLSIIAAAGSIKKIHFTVSVYVCAATLFVRVFCDTASAGCTRSLPNLYT